MATTQTGPRLRVVSECTDCEHLREKSYAAQGDSGYVVSCAHPDGKGRIGDTTWATPAWCPELPAARLALARSVVAAVPCEWCGGVARVCGDPSCDGHRAAVTEEQPK